VKQPIHALAAAASWLMLSPTASGNETPATLAALTLENDFFAGYDHH
jgi:hypothetical protein